jgi:choice-of-anchor A domain-containing protein
MLAKNGVKLQGTMGVDSYDSTDPLKSTGGQYDPTKMQENGSVASMSTGLAIDAISGDLWGDLITGAGGTVSIGGSFSHNSGSVEDTAPSDIPDVIVPFDTTFTDPAITGNRTFIVSGDRDISVPEIKLVGSKKLTFTGSGTVRIYVEGETSFSGSSEVVIDPDPTGSVLNVEFYCNDDVFLNNVVNAPGLAKNFTVYGTPNCDIVEYHGSDDFIGTIYAPQAEYTHNGLGEFNGALVAGEINYLGNASFHYDESLAGVKREQVYRFRIASWLEL